MTALNDFQTDLSDIEVISDRDHLKRLALDAWPVVAKWDDATVDAKLPLFVALPRTTEQVAKVVRFAAKRQLPIVPVAGRSGVVGGAIPHAGSLSLDVGYLDQIISFRADRARVRVQAGMYGKVLEEWLNERGFTLGHYPQSLATSTVGGWVATRSSGTFSAKYGGIERLACGLVVVGADGDTVDIPAFVRAAAGPDLLQLFCGSEGTMGIITEVELRVTPLPACRIFEGWHVPDLGVGLVSIKATFDAHLQPAVLRLYDEVEAEHLYKRSGQGVTGPLLIVGYEGNVAMVETHRSELSKILLKNGSVPLGEPVGNAWDSGRYRADWLIEGNSRADLIADSIEVSATWPQLLPLYQAIQNALAGHVSSVMAHWSHFYTDGAGMYVIVKILDSDPSALIAKYDYVWQVVMGLTLKHDGAISHHHGTGARRAVWMPDALGTAYPLLGRLKAALDPDSIFNPGVLVAATAAVEHGSKGAVGMVSP